MPERAYPTTAHDWLDFSQRLYRAAYITQRARRGRWAKNIARAAEMAADKAADLSTSLTASPQTQPSDEPPAAPSPSIQGAAGKGGTHG